MFWLNWICERQSFVFRIPEPAPLFLRIRLSIDGKAIVRAVNIFCQFIETVSNGGAKLYYTDGTDPRLYENSIRIHCLVYLYRLSVGWSKYIKCSYLRTFFHADGIRSILNVYTVDGRSWYKANTRIKMITPNKYSIYDVFINMELVVTPSHWFSNQTVAGIMSAVERGYNIKPLGSI